MKNDSQAARWFTWSQSESLEELVQPARAAAIRRRQLKVVQAQAARPDRPLMDVFADALDDEDDQEGCLICHL